MRIPPRPVVEPALAKDDLRAEMGEKLMASCEAALEGNLPETKKGLEEAGKRGADGIREYIDSQIPPPNSPVTLSGGWIYNRVAKKGVYVEGKNGSTPMKDTGALYDDFDHYITRSFSWIYLPPFLIPSWAARPSRWSGLRVLS